jgi:ribulose-5-phosphate 4-epimerase/fuculose-1-phosphate aldolase
MPLELEWKTRCDLAAIYRIFSALGWTDEIFTHISARINGTNYILMNPYGYLYEEITASSLVRLDLQNTTDTDKLYNRVGYNIHSAIHNARPDIKYVIHTHTVPIVAVSALADGLEPVSQYGVYITNHISYHNYEGIVFYEDEKDRLVKDIGSSTFCLMRNHGSIVLSNEVEGALFNQYILQKACEVQVAIQSTGKEYITVPNSAVSRTIEYNPVTQKQDDRASFLLWSALKRKIDKENPGYDQ